MSQASKPRCAVMKDCNVPWVMMSIGSDDCKCWRVSVKTFRLQMTEMSQSDAQSSRCHASRLLCFVQKQCDVVAVIKRNTTTTMVIVRFVSRDLCERQESCPVVEGAGIKGC